MRARRGTLYLADLSPQAGTDPGKVRPVLAIQTDLLNEAGHPSTWVLPCTTRLTGENLLRVVLPRGIAGNREDCEVMVDQSRAIDNPAARAGAQAGTARHPGGGRGEAAHSRRALRTAYR